MAGRDFVVVVASAAVLMFFISGQTAESRMQNLCSHTAYPSLCSPLVSRASTPTRATHRTIQVLVARTKSALTEAARYKDNDQAIATCYATMSDAVYNLVNARKSIRRRDVLSLNTYLSAAVSDYGACVDAFIERGQVNTVQNAVVDLRKISSNCLTLSTFLSL